MKNEALFTAFLNSYLATVNWLENETGRCLEFGQRGIRRATHDCQLFFDKVAAEFTADEALAILEYEGNDVTCLAAHDFYLTRNGHGAGFFDKEIYDDLADNGRARLTKISHEIGGIDCYIQRGKIQFDDYYD